MALVHIICVRALDEEHIICSSWLLSTPFTSRQRKVLTPGQMGFLCARLNKFVSITCFPSTFAPVSNTAALIVHNTTRGLLGRVHPIMSALVQVGVCGERAHTRGRRSGGLV